jgi:hypothetical protein
LLTVVGLANGEHITSPIMRAPQIKFPMVSHIQTSTVFLIIFFKGFSVFTNTKDVNKQWTKAAHGEKLFRDIVSRLNNVKHREELKQSLVQLLSDRTQ